MSIKVKDHPGLIRDPFSKAVVNVDQNSYNTYIEQRNRMKMQIETVENSKQEVQQLKQDVAELKALMLQIASKLQGKE
jgi:DNA repair ATPase RecN